MKKFIISFCLILFALSTWGQTREIKGQIKGPDQQPIPGVTIIQDGTQNGTVTDDDGNYSLQVPDSGSVVLTASYTGYSDQKIVVGEQSEYNIAMDTEKADEVVVIGYGTVKKSDLTGSVSHLKGEEVREVPAGNVLESIQGKAAGVDIVRTSGEAGKAPNITIRGNRSISAGNGPLYIVDGVQYSNIQDVNPNDIESMEVLKDASSTAIYGSRGANGVIIITTKKGKSGEGLRVFVNAYTGVSTRFAYPRAMTGTEFAKLRSDAGVALNAEEQYNLDNGIMTDYTDEVLHNGAQKDIQIGVTGGTDKLRTYFSLGYYNERGLLKYDELDRYTGRFNVDYSVSKFLKIGTQTQITYYDQSRRTNPLGNAAKINPLTSPYNAEGNLILNPGGKHANPLLDEFSNNSTNQRKMLRIFPTIYGEVKFLKKFTARTNLAINWDNRNTNIFHSTGSFTLINNNSAGQGAFASHETDNRVQLNWQGIINYNTEINKDHSIGITALSEIITNSQERFNIEARNQTIPEQLFYNLADNAASSINSRYKASKLVSFAARANYSYKSKYLLTVTGRSDGASVLAEGHKWNFFPSVAAGWRISDESFMDFQNTFNSIKLRASWGITGNSNIEPYSTQSTLIKIPYSFDQAAVTAYAYRPQIGNTETTWEKSNTIDFGIDFGALQDRITGSIDYYDTKTNDLLLTRKLPLSSGVGQTVANVGKTRNRGIELAATSVNIDKKKFRWTTTLTFTRNVERIVSLIDGLNTLQVTTLDPEDAETKTVVVGSPVNSFYDYEKIGVWQTSEKDAAAVYGAVPGNIKIKDQNGDGKITTDDRTVVGSNVPKWSAGFNSEFKILENFDVSFYLFSRVGQIINYQYQYDAMGGENSLSSREYWTPNNPTNDLPGAGLTIDSRFLNTINYVDGSFLKLRSATIGYTLPGTLAKKFGMSRLRVYVTGKNLLVLSKIKDYDPEMGGSLTFPSVRLFVGGINLEF